jgi:hypothetical protein
MSESSLSVSSIKERLICAGVPLYEFVGCSDEEVQELEVKYACNLPEEYKIFLKVMGKSSGPLFEDIDISFLELDEIIAEAEEVNRLGRRKLPKKHFVFSCRDDGDVFTFFDLSIKSPDPPVFRFVTGVPGYSEGWSSFSELIEMQYELVVRTMKSYY